MKTKTWKQIGDKLLTRIAQKSGKLRSALPSCVVSWTMLPPAVPPLFGLRRQDKSASARVGRGALQARRGITTHVALCMYWLLTSCKSRRLWY